MKKISDVAMQAKLNELGFDSIDFVLLECMETMSKKTTFKMVIYNTGVFGKKLPNLELTEEEYNARKSKFVEHGLLVAAMKDTLKIILCNQTNESNEFGLGHNECEWCSCECVNVVEQEWNGKTYNICKDCYDKYNCNDYYILNLDSL